MSQQTPIWVGDLGQAPDPQHKKVQTTSQYLMMRDGVKIALDVMLPRRPCALCAPPCNHGHGALLAQFPFADALTAQPSTDWTP
jgi:hypothetical protein